MANCGFRCFIRSFDDKLLARQHGFRGKSKHVRSRVRFPDEGRYLVGENFQEKDSGGKF